MREPIKVSGFIYYKNGFHRSHNKPEAERDIKLFTNMIFISQVRDALNDIFPKGSALPFSGREIKVDVEGVEQWFILHFCCCHKEFVYKSSLRNGIFVADVRRNNAL